MGYVSDGKKAATYQLTHEALTLVEQLSERLGLPKQSVIEMAVREYAEKRLEPARRSK